MARVFGVAGRGQTYARLLYVLVSFPVSIAVFVALVTAVATGVGLAITIVGLPLLFATMYAWCVVAELERVLANQMLGSAIRPLPFGGEQGRVWSPGRAKQRAANTHTWRAFAFLILRFPVATAAFVAVTATLGSAVALMATPVTQALGGETVVGNWQLDSFKESLVAAVAGLLLVIPALHAVSLTGWLMGRFNELWLQSDGATGAAGGGLERVATAALLWPGAGAAQRRGAGTRAVTFQFRAWVFHAGLYLAVMAGLVLINGAASPDNWWVLWPAWGWGIALALHTGYYLGGHLGGHIAAYIVSCVGFFVIDSLYTDQSWFYWPVIGWGVVVAAHVYAINAFSRGDSAPAVVLAASGPREAMILVDPVMRTVSAGARPVEVTPKEFELLALLTAHPGRPFSREELLDRIWKDDLEVTDRTIDTHVQRLRKKLGDHADAIQTVWGIGYRYQP